MTSITYRVSCQSREYNHSQYSIQFNPLPDSLHTLKSFPNYGQMGWLDGEKSPYYVVLNLIIMKIV